MSSLDAKTVYGSIAVIALTIYAIRVVPFLFLRKPIRSRWFKSFLYYVPYVTLAVMTFPAILTATQNPAAGAVALMIGVVMAWVTGNLFAVSISCCAAVLILGAVL